MELKVFESPAEVARAAAQLLVEQCRDAVARSNGFAVALSGGSTPKLLYALLADPKEPFRDQIAWKKAHFFFTDERNVPPDHPDSNYRMVYEAMFSRAPKTNVYRIPGEQPADRAANDYEHILEEVFEDIPDLDLIFLGLGEDGHTASLFPHSPALKETERLVVAPYVVKLNAYRITMTLPVLNNGKSVVFLVTGASKATALREINFLKNKTDTKPDIDPDLYPAQAISPTSGAVSWLVDKAAARLCSHNNSSNIDDDNDLLNKNP